ncbi:MAG: PAS domain S-box protein [Acidobacteriia bacterium]|nr:PAS domain S-box protein [Terriglobia bacterium]
MVRPSSRGDKSQPVRSADALAEILISHNLLEAIPDAIVAVDGAGTILQVNSQTEQLFGYSRDLLIGQKVEILVPARHRRKHRGHRDAFAETPKVRRMGAGLDLHGRRRDGSEFPVEISLSPVSVEKGSLILSAIRDISDRKRIEEDLRRVNEELEKRTAQQLGDYRARLASIVDSSEDAILSKDLQGTITSWNKGAERIYGYTAAEVVGKPISMLTPKDRPNEIASILEKIRRGESIEHHETIRVTKNGHHLNMSISVSPLRDTSGNIAGASVIARDITAQKKTEDHLRQAQKMEAVGRLAGGVAHDFNNILGIITSCTELLRDRVDPQAEYSQYITHIRKASERGASLTRQLLAFSRKSVVQFQVLDLNDRLKDVGKLLRPLMGDDVEVLIVPKFSSAVIEADPGQLDQIVVNLAVNARDAMPHGGKFILETTTVYLDETFSAQHGPMIPGKYVMLAVSDTGSGMDESTQARIFEPFFTTKELGKGTGLGLATVYGIVQHSGGHIWVYSELGRGTTFKIYFPNAEHKIGIATKPEVESALPKPEGTTILLVEDDEIMRSLTRQLLVEQGYRVIEAADGRAALEGLAAHPGRIDLLLTDVVMRGMSGPELVTRVSQSHPSAKVVYMSGYTGELITEHEILKSGITLLEKPFTRSALLKTVHTSLG